MFLRREYKDYYGCFELPIKEKKNGARNQTSTRETT